MKNSTTMRPIVLKGAEAANALEEAMRQSLRNGRATAACKKANAKPPVVAKKCKS